MPTVRRLALIIALLVAAVFAATPAQARDEVSIRVEPGTVRTGGSFTIEARCDDDPERAIARSRLFGEVTLIPRRDVLTAEVRVPQRSRSGRYAVNLRCPSARSAHTEIFVADLPEDKERDPRPTLGPATGGGGADGGRAGSGGAPVTLPLLAAGGMAALVAGAGLLVRSRT
jgi:hypothetical protein